MTKPDLLICWIKHCDYPLFRIFLQVYRDFFNKVIIYWSEHFREVYFDKFIEEDLKDLDITFLPSIEYKYGTEDWRNVATNYMLTYSDSEWVCSIEQDWLCWNWDLLLNQCKTFMTYNDLFGWMNPTNAPYVHPSFFFAKRELIDKCGKDFGPHPEVNGGDHFCQITWKAKELGAKIGSLPVGGVNPNSLAFHLGGINQNYLDGINTKIFHRPDIFSVYNYYNKRATEKQSPEFMKLMDKVEELLPMSEENNLKWAKFFK